MARNLLKRYNNVEEYNRVKCTLDIRQISLINTYKDTKYGTEYDTVTSVYKVRNKSNKINLFNSATLVNSMSRMYINGIEVEPTNEFQFDNYENATIECEFCNLTSIPDDAFRGCTFLTSIEIPNSITKIGGRAFNSCNSLTSITIPNSVTSIGNGAFYNCRSLSSIDISNSVTSIGNEAFYNCYSLTSITIPNSVTSIGDMVFYNCYSLSEITIPSGVTSIGNYAFYSCYSLSEITIPDSVETIGNYAFDSCYSLSSIDIPSGVTSIGNKTFDGCSSLNSIDIPNSITKIGNSAFANCYSLSEIDIPDSVKTIGNNAFDGCRSLSEITCLATTAPTVSSNTFRYICSNGILYYPQGSDYSSWLSTNSSYLGYYDWIGNELQDAYDFKVNFITNGVKVDSPYNSLIINDIEGIKQSDNSYLFSGLQPMNSCYEFDLIADGEVIEKVDIRYNNKWITVGDNSSLLTCIYKPSQSTTIYSGNNLTYSGAYVDGEYVGTLSSSYTFTEISEHIIQYSGVTSIGSSAFTNCYSLSEITIPDSVKRIGNYAFTNCYLLSEIDIPSGVTSIGNNAFDSCYSLSSIDIPSGVTSIGNNTFDGCSSLNSIDIPNSITKIGNSAFTNCYSLSEIDIPDSVKTIGNYVFHSCSSLTSITIPSGVTSIGNNTFYNCYSLSSIDISNSVTSIGNEAFYNCYSLSEIDIPDSVKRIGNYAFTNCYLLSEIDIPSGVTSIGNKTFTNCYSLSEITIPSGVTSIGNSAFTNCYSLSEITCLAETAPTVSSYTFSNVSSLGVLYYPGMNSSYDTWKSYLPNWDFVPLYTPQECTNLVISAENVYCRATSTTISYTATTNGVDYYGNFVSGIEVTRTATSESFSQNTDTENEVIRTITFEYMGLTASTTITQGVWFDAYYEIDLNNQWQLSSTISNPDSLSYDGVYESFSNKGVGNSAAICTITINGYEKFKLYVRSYAQSSYDFVVVSNLDCTLSSGITATTNSNVKMTTSGNQQSGTAIGNYTEVEFSGIDGELHTIQVMYRKNSSTNRGTDQGYLLIPKNQ